MAIAAASPVAPSPGAVSLPLARNLGEIWFGKVKPRHSAPLVLMGLTHESDLFILTRLAEGSGAKTEYEGTHDWRSGRGSVHHLNSRSRLDGASAALTDGGEWWAGLLGAALMQKNWSGLEQGGRKRKVALQLEQSPAANSPRYLVSWLLSWPLGSSETG